MVKACEMIVRIMFLNKLYSEFDPIIRIKFPFSSRPNLIFYKPYMTSRNGSLMHITTAYTSHVQNRNTSVIVEYHNELWENSKSNYTFVWAPEKNVQELLSNSVHVFSCIPCHVRQSFNKMNTLPSGGGRMITLALERHWLDAYIHHSMLCQRGQSLMNLHNSNYGAP